jgi:glycerate kinase
VVIAGDTAIVESAGANGIELLAADELNPMAATTYGVGEMLSLLYEAGFRKYLIGIGGSATVDGGAGMIQALGGRLLDKAGNELPPGIGGGALHDVASADLSALSKWHECTIQVACDVTNVLCGYSGAAYVFGPQKGANEEMVRSLDANLRHWADILDDAAETPGDGAAGGLGFALRYVLRADMVSGAELVMQYSGFHRELAGAALVITGEGCSDEQTVCGKLCSCVAHAAHAQGVPVMLFSGALRGDTRSLEAVFDGCYSIASGPGTLENAIAATAENLRRAGANVARIAGKL